MEKKRRGSWIDLYKRILNRMFPKCKSTSQFIFTFLAIAIALTVAVLVIYAILTLAVLTVAFMVEKVWPLVLFTVLGAVAIFCHKYEDDLLKDKKPTESAANEL